MTTPKTLSQKIAQHQNDSFNVWMQKTNIAANEIGDLNKLSSPLLVELQSLTARSGTVSVNIDPLTGTGPQVLKGTGTTFTNSLLFSVGDLLKITTVSPASVIEKRIQSIVDNETIIVDTPFQSTFSGATYENLQSLSLVYALNHIYEQEIRRCLIRSIAMS